MVNRIHIAAVLDALEADIRRLDRGATVQGDLARHADALDAMGLEMLGKHARRLAMGETHDVISVVMLVSSTRGLLRRAQRAEEHRAGMVLDLETGGAP